MDNRHRFSYIYSVGQISPWVASCWDFQYCAAEDFLCAFAAVHNILIGFLFSSQLWNSLSRMELAHLWFFLLQLLWIRACVFLKHKKKKKKTRDTLQVTVLNSQAPPMNL